MHRMLLVLAAVGLAVVGARATGPAVAQDSSAGPQIASAVGVSRTRVRLRFSEPVSSGGVAADDFVLTMGGEPRRVSRVDLDSDGRTAEIEAKPAWPYGTAGAVRLRGEKSVRVWATPGDVEPPVMRGVRLDKRVVCVIGLSRGCRSNGGTVRYTVDEPVSVVLDLRHRATDAPSLMKVSRPAGRGSVRFGSKIEGRRLRPGSFRLTVTAVDHAGNESRPTTLSLRVRR